MKRICGLLPGIARRGLNKIFLSLSRHRGGLQIPSLTALARLSRVRVAMTLATSQDPACQQVYASLLNDGPPADQSQRTHGPTILNNTLMSLAGAVGILAPAGYKNSDADLRPGAPSQVWATCRACIASRQRARN
jgi:hypothetical protein